MLFRSLCVTAGAAGSTAYYDGSSVHVPAFTLGGTIDTTGAGDTFGGCMLHAVLRHGLDGLGHAALTEALRFANAAAYLVTTHKGALCSMPEQGAIDAVLHS